jgi:hypothetical protein
MHYPPTDVVWHPLTVILRAHILSVRSPQLRFVVRGTRGGFTKYGLDVQEATLKAMASPKQILDEGYGKEPETLWGTLQLLKGNAVTVESQMYDDVLIHDVGFGSHTYSLLVVGHRMIQDYIRICSEIFLALFVTGTNWL